MSTMQWRVEKMDRLESFKDVLIVNFILQTRLMTKHHHGVFAFIYSILPTKNNSFIDHLPNYILPQILPTYLTEETLTYTTSNSAKLGLLLIKNSWSIISLTNFTPMVHFYTPWKCQKHPHFYTTSIPFGFLTFWEV